MRTSLAANTISITSCEVDAAVIAERVSAVRSRERDTLSSVGPTISAQATLILRMESVRIALRRLNRGERAASATTRIKKINVWRTMSDLENIGNCIESLIL